jgi:ribosomal protein S18 acetylase RimI-like enzyme
MNPNEIFYISGGQELLDDIEPLWEGLNTHHEAVSPHFKGDFRYYTFEQRVEKLLKKIQNGKLRIDLAKAGEHTVGYVVSSVSEDGVGEIESIFIKHGYRERAIGDHLMRRTLAWLDDCDAHTKLIEVATGNEGSYKFYARFGFFPRVTTLQQKNADTP